MIKKWIFENLVWIFSIISLFIGIYCIWVIGTDIFQISSFDVYKRTDLLRNILLGLGALIAVPFLVWQNTTSHKALHETKENNQKTHSTKMYIDCITQLATDKETIRTAAIHGLHELIKNTKDDSLKEKIFNILWSFMVEHSKKCIKVNDQIENHQKIKYPTLEDLQKQLKTEQENIEKFYSQFKIILQILAKHKDKKHREWWKDKSMCNIRLHGINLVHTVLKNANLSYIDLQNVDLMNANLQGAVLNFAKLQGVTLWDANLQGAWLILPQDNDLRNANLQGAKYNSKQWTDPETQITYESTKFPENFDPKAHGMIDVSEEKY